MVKKKIVAKISKNEYVSQEEVLELLKSKWYNYKSFGIIAVKNQKIKSLAQNVIELVDDKDEIIVSDAIECLLEIDKNLAFEVSMAHIENSSVLVQASCLYVIAELKKYEAFTKVFEISKKYLNNQWLRLSFLRTFYILDKQKKVYIDEIILILNKTSDYHIQCNAINTLDDLKNKKNARIIEETFISFSKKKIYPNSVTTTLNRVMGKV